MKKIILKAYDSEGALSYLRSKSKYWRKRTSQKEIQISAHLRVQIDKRYRVTYQHMYFAYILGI